VMPISQVVPSSVVRMSRKSNGGILTVALYGIRGGVKISTLSSHSISVYNRRNIFN
jgi:hypothetical protein